MEDHRDVTRFQRPARGKRGGRDGSGERPPDVSVRGHRLLRRIGSGSYGEVWLAIGPSGKYRAVKIIRRERFEHLRPFERELSGIRGYERVSHAHEGLLQVLQIGINELQGNFYYVMELADDYWLGQIVHPEDYTPGTLARRIQIQGALPAELCVRFGLRLSVALAELHRHGLVHRDIKPSNIIFVNGAPKLADIGLVAPAAEAGSYVGTAGFIPPEGPGTVQADIYSLGKVLYETCTGMDREQFPELPTHLGRFSNRKLFLELNEIILKACQPDKRKRYTAASELHADLSKAANGEPVKKFHWRGPQRIGLGRISLASLLPILLAGLFLFEARHSASVNIESREQELSAFVAQGTRASESGDLVGSLLFFTEALRLESGSAGRELPHRLRIGSALSSSAKLEQLWFSTNGFTDACFSPDGRTVLLTEQAGGARAFDVVTGKPLDGCVDRDRLCGASYSPDGKWVVTAGDGFIARIRNLGDSSRSLELKHPGQVLSARFSPGGSRVVTACADHKSRVWNARTGELVRVLEGHADSVLFAAFSHDGRLIVTASRDGTARLWDAQDGREILPALPHDAGVTCAAFSPDDEKLITGCLDYKVRVWDCRTGGRIFPELDSHDGILTAEFSPDGRWILTASLAGMARLWQADKLLPLGWNPVPSRGVTRACFDPFGCRILTTCSDGTARIWNLAGSSALPAASPADPRHGGDAAKQKLKLLSPDRSRVLTVAGKLVHVLDLRTGQAAFAPLKHPEPVVYAEFSRDGSRVVTCCANQEVARCCAQVWNASTGCPEGASLVHNDGVLFASFSPDGRRVVTASEDFTAMVWDVETGRPLTPPLLHQHQVRTARFSPDGRWIVTACQDRTTRIWSAETGDPLTPPVRGSADLAGAGFLPDGRAVWMVDSEGNNAAWPLPIDPRPVEDLRKIGRLLAGRCPGPGMCCAPGVPESSISLFRGLRDKYPSSFEVSGADVAAWHEHEARESEIERQWRAAAFHWNRVRALRPQSEAVVECLNRAIRNSNLSTADEADEED